MWLDHLLSKEFCFARVFCFTRVFFGVDHHGDSFFYGVDILFGLGAIVFVVSFSAFFHVLVFLIGVWGLLVGCL